MKEYQAVPAAMRGWYIVDEYGLLIKVMTENSYLARQIVKLLNDETLKLKGDME